MYSEPEQRAADSSTPNRKIFGDKTGASAKPPKKARATHKTSFQAMVEQGPGPGQQVSECMNAHTTQQPDKQLHRTRTVHSQNGFIAVDQVSWVFSIATDSVAPMVMAMQRTTLVGRLG